MMKRNFSSHQVSFFVIAGVFFFLFALLLRPCPAGAETDPALLKLIQQQTVALQGLQSDVAALAKQKSVQAAPASAPAQPAPAAPTKVNGTLAQQVHELQTRLAVLEQLTMEGRSNPLPIYIGGFAYGSAELSAQQKLEIGAVVGVIRKEIPGGSVDLIGYASEGGDADKNNQLAGKRAESVKKYMDALMAVPPAQVASAGGTTAPAPASPVVSPDNIRVYAGGETAEFSLRLGPSGLNQGVKVVLTR